MAGCSACPLVVTWESCSFQLSIYPHPSSLHHHHPVPQTKSRKPRQDAASYAHPHRDLASLKFLLLPYCQVLWPWSLRPVLPPPTPGVLVLTSLQLQRQSHTPHDFRTGKAPPHPPSLSWCHGAPPTARRHRAGQVGWLQDQEQSPESLPGSLGYKLILCLHFPLPRSRV